MASLIGMRNENGTLVSHTWPGFYPVYYVDNENNVLCPDCANKEDMSTEVVACDVNWEDTSLYCDDCSQQIDSAYGDDDEETEDED